MQPIPTISLSSAGHEHWLTKYLELIDEQANRAVHPLHEDNPYVLSRVTTKFFDLFNNAPEGQRKTLLETPLFPDRVYFSKDATRENARPLNYIMWTGHKKALDAVVPYLSYEDLNARGPYNATFVHCVIAGVEKGATFSNEPEKCIEWLLQQNSLLKNEPNAFGTTPLQFAKEVQLKLQRNQRHVDAHGGGGYGGYGRSCSVTDVKGGTYSESSDRYDTLLYQIEKILKLLSK